MTNDRMIAKLMGLSVVSQMFIFDALLKHAEAVAQSAVGDYPPNSIVSPSMWISTARQIEALMKEHLCVKSDLPIVPQPAPETRSQRNVP